MSNLTSRQRMQTGMVYEAIARLLPVEGKDYTLTVNFDPDDKVIIQMNGLTPFGLKWVEYCRTGIPEILTGKKETSGHKEVGMGTGSVPVS